jgi:hypothetical protein
MMRRSRPAKDLYDCVEDRYELRNLASNPIYREVIYLDVRMLVAPPFCRTHSILLFK